MSTHNQEELADRDYDILQDYYYGNVAATDDEDEKAERWILSLTDKDRKMFIKEQLEEDKIQRADCIECLDEGMVCKVVKDENGAIVDSFMVKCPHCSYE